MNSIMYYMVRLTLHVYACIYKDLIILHRFNIRAACSLSASCCHNPWYVQQEIHKNNNGIEAFYFMTGFLPPSAQNELDAYAELEFVAWNSLFDSSFHYRLHVHAFVKMRPWESDIVFNILFLACWKSELLQDKECNAPFTLIEKFCVSDKEEF